MGKTMWAKAQSLMDTSIVVKLVSAIVIVLALSTVIAALLVALTHWFGGAFLKAVVL